jgi:DNA-binding MarR family transcriptional regulator
MMTPTQDDIAKRYASRPGCRFIGHEPVGIAFFAMNVRAVVTESRPLSPIDEFLLRSLNHGIDNPQALEGFLGLDRRTVDGRLIELRREELIEVGGHEDDSGLRCVLTTKGLKAAEIVERSEIAETTIPVMFHGFLRRPMMQREAELLRPFEIRNRGWREISAIPTRNPRPEEIELDALDRVLGRQWKQRRNSPPPKLLAVRSVMKGVKTLYLPAVMLVYEVLGNPEQRQVAFAIDGVLNEEYEREFAARGGIKRLADLKTEAFKTTAQLAAEYLAPTRLQEMGSLEGVDELKEKVDVVESVVFETESRLDAEDRTDTRQTLRNELAEKREELSALQQELKKHKAVRLATYDCAACFQAALSDANERLVIVSAFLSSYVVDRDFIGKLDDALARGVTVWIAYGLRDRGGPEGDRSKRRDWEEAEKSLAQLRKKHRSTLKIAFLGDTHEKILLCDTTYVITGSFNWLSFRGDKGRKRRREDALLVTYPPIIEEYFAEITSRFEQ